MESFVTTTKDVLYTGPMLECAMHLMSHRCERLFGIDSLPSKIRKEDYVTISKSLTTITTCFPSV